MKRLCALFLAVVLCFCFAACGEESATPEPTKAPVENKDELRAKELADGLCGGRWISNEYPERAYIFHEDGTVECQKLNPASGEVESTENSEWKYRSYLINGEIEGQPGSATPTMLLINNGYCTEEDGLYVFQYGGRMWDSVGCTKDGNWIACLDDWFFQKVTE